MSGTLALTVDSDFHALVADILLDHEPAADERLAATLAETGLADLTRPEADGGSGATVLESAVLIRALAHAGSAIDAGTSDLVASWLLAASGQPGETRLRTVRFEGVPAGAVARDESGPAESIVVATRNGGRWVLADIADGRDAHGGEPPVNEIIVDDDVIIAAKQRKALVDALRLTGLLNRAVTIAIAHAQERTQFGRPIAQRQLVQDLLVASAGEASLATVATEAAAIALARFGDGSEEFVSRLEIACSTTGHAVDIVTRKTHQVVGAIGTTQEHILHRFTGSAMKLRTADMAVRNWDSAVFDRAVRDRAVVDLDLVLPDHPIGITREGE